MRISKDLQFEAVGLFLCLEKGMGKKEWRLPKF